MHPILLFFHIAAAIVWMGGMVFMVLALRGPLTQQLAPPVRLPLMAAVLARFFVLVAVSIALLWATGLWMFLAAPRGSAPAGWHAMAALGLVMSLIFAHLFFAPYRRMQRAVAAADWPEGGRRAGQITLLAKINLALGWLAIGAVLVWR